jgi:hypothetical protein
MVLIVDFSGNSIGEDSLSIDEASVLDVEMEVAKCDSN